MSPVPKAETEGAALFDIDSADNSEVLEEQTASRGRGYAAGSRLWVPLTPEGAVDIGRAKQASLDKLRTAVRTTPLFAQESDLAGAPSAFSDKAVAMVIGFQSMLETQVAIKKFKVPAEIAEKVYPYTQDETQELTETLQKVIAKYPFLNNFKYKEEIDYVCMSLTIFAQKTLLLRELLQKQHPVSTAPPANGSAQAQAA